MVDDKELLSRIAAREASAVTLLYDAYAKLIYGVALAILHDTDDAEDVVQEVFIQVWRKAGLYEPTLGSVKNWLVRIGHNRAINLLRSKRSQERISEFSLSEDDESLRLDIVDAENENPWQQVARIEESETISAALNTLPPEQRQLVDLSFFQGYSHAEIAEIVALPLGTVKTRIRSGLQALRGQLKFLKVSY